MSGSMRWAGVLLMILTTAAAAQSAQENLKKARTLIGQNKFAPGLKLVERAIAEPGNDLETTLELLELQGVANAALKRSGPAKLAFQRLISLAPNHTLKRRGPPPVLKAWAEAKTNAWPLAILPSSPNMSTGRISEIAVEVRNDPLKLAKTIVFNYRVGGGKWKVRAIPAAMGRVDAKVDAEEKVEWYATVLGPNDAEIMRIRTLESPITHTYQAPTREVADAPRREEEPEDPRLTPADRPPELELVESGRKRAGWVVPISVTLIAAGAGAGGVGTYFAVQSRDARRQFASATGGSEEVVVGVTRRGALQLDSQARNGAVIANTLWISAGALIVTGLAVALFGPAEAVQ